MRNIDNCIIFGLSNGYEYAKEVSKATNINLGTIKTTRFADGEILVKSGSTVRGKDVFIFQSTCNPVNDNLMELLIAIDSLKRASANSITVIIPYYGYARQDRKAKGREPITCKLVANFIENSGATKVILADIHSEQTQGFFNVPVDTLRASSVLLNEFMKEYEGEEICSVAPDYGAVKKARDISEHLNIGLAIVDKRRPKPNVVEVSNVLGDVKNKHCIIVDDMIDTGGTVLSNTKLLREHGASKITVFATHGVFSNNAIEKFKRAIHEGDIDGLYVSDTIPNNLKISHKGIYVISLSKFFADVISAQINHQSVSEIYEKYWNSVCYSCTVKRKK